MSNLMALMLGLGVFAVIVAVGWRSVQNRRILRMRDANGHETVIIASEDDEVTSIDTTVESPAASSPRHDDPVAGTMVMPVAVPVADTTPAPAGRAMFGKSSRRKEAAAASAAATVEADAAGRERLERVVTSNR